MLEFNRTAFGTCSNVTAATRRTPRSASRVAAPLQRTPRSRVGVNIRNVDPDTIGDVRIQLLDGAEDLQQPAAISGKG